MLSKKREKFILSLRKKKTREELGLYLIEGDKMVKDYIDSGMKIVLLAARPEFIASFSPGELSRIKEITPVSFDELRKISTLKTPHNALALAEIPSREFDFEAITSGLVAALDSLQDPGNLGTIIRAAAWFGIKNIVCSTSSVDVFNPKTVQASMGSIPYVNIWYTDLPGFLSRVAEKGLPVYGSVLDGEPVCNASLGDKGIIIIGNESKGISGEVEELVTRRITIPGSGFQGKGTESLNAAMAASVIFYEFARRKGQR